MSQVPPESIDAEPIVMWRLRNADDGRRAFSVIGPVGAKAAVGWFSQGLLQESFDFATWEDAIGWLESKVVTLRSHGWQPEEAFDCTPDPDHSS